MRRDRRYLVDQRPILGAGFQPNGRDLGAYGLAGYRFDHAWNVMPYALYEYYKPLERVLFGKMRAATVGNNFRPTPTIVLNTTVSAGQTEGAGQFGELGRVYYFTGQAAWVF